MPAFPPLRAAHRELSFTLVEVMIVVAIIILLAAVSIPNLLRARINANEAAAIQSTKTLATAQQSYRTSNPSYTNSFASFTDAVPPYIDSALGTGSKQGYGYDLARYVGPNSTSFQVIAMPTTWSRTGKRGFCVTEEGPLHVFTQEQYNTMSWDSICYGSNTLSQ